MRLLTARVSALAILCTSGAVLAQQRDAPAAKLSEKVAIIRGRVTAADTGRALRNATVRVAGQSTAVEARSAVTDTDGRFEIRELSAGRYSVSVSKPGYVSVTHGQRRPDDGGQPIELREAAVAERVNFVLQRGGVITGAVSDEFGEPVVGAYVRPHQFRFQQGRRELTAVVGGVLTNDIGEFRLFGLSPGDFVVSVSTRVPFGQVDQADSSFPPTFFPSTQNVGEARLVRVRAGATNAGLNIQVASARAAKVRGFALDATGHPLSNALVSLILTETEYGVASGQVKRDGSFVLSGVPPGDYSLLARSSDRGSDGRPQVAATTLTVSGDDVDNVQLVAAQWNRISGRLTVDSRSEVRDVLQSTRLQLHRLGRSDPLQHYGGSTQVKRDLTFEMDAPVGDVVLRAGSLPEGWRLKAVRIAGADVSDSGFSLPVGEQVEDVELELTNKGPVLAGRVVRETAEPVKPCRVLVFAQEPDGRAWPSRRIATAQAAADGTFHVHSLPPGDYFVAAFEFVAPGQEYDADFLTAAEERAVRVSLAAQDSKFIELKLVPE